MKIVSFLAILSLLVFANCKKDNSSTPATQKDVLTGGSSKTWLLQTTKNTLNNNTSDDTKNCEKDDFITFKSDNTFISDEGAVKCYSTDDQTHSGTFSMSADEKTITEIAKDYTNVYKIVELNSSRLTLSTSFSVGYYDITTTISFIPK